MEHRITLRDAFGNMLGPSRRKVGIVHKWEDIHEDSFAVVGLECVCTLDVKRIEVAYFGDRFSYAGVGLPVLQK